jgi:hypothetical protein
MKAKFQKKDIIAALVKMRLVECASTKTLMDFLGNQLGYSKTTSYEYLKLMRESIKDQYSLLNPSMIEEAIGQYEEAIEMARQRKDWKLWNDLRRELNKIQGVYATEKIDITTNGKDLQITEITVNIQYNDMRTIGTQSRENNRIE